MNTPLHAITFDLDGTLYSLRSMVLRNLPAMMGLFGFFKALHGIRDDMRGSGPVDDFRAEQVRRFAARTGMDEAKAAAMIEGIIDEKWPEMFCKVRPYAGVQEVVKTLREMGLGLAVVSDYPIEKKLRMLGLNPETFDALVVTEDVGALKPHPLPFVRVAERLGIAPRNVLHVGDREDCDVAGAHAAGMLAGLFRPGIRGGKSAAEIVFGRWKRFVPLLKERGWL